MLLGFTLYKKESKFQDTKVRIPLQIVSIAASPIFQNAK